VKKVIVDIDNTLWNFASVLYERMKKANPDIIPLIEWNKFDFWKYYMSARTFYSIIKGIHLDQKQFTPFSDAQPFLTSLKEMGIHIIIASHREKGTLDATVNWLKSNGLIFDEIHLSYDKTVLFDDCWAIIDDSPFILEKAAGAGVIATGLKMPWNEHEDYPLFHNLPEVLHYLKGQICE